MSIIKNLLMVKIEFKKGTAFDTTLEDHIDAMKELKEKKGLPKKGLCPEERLDTGFFIIKFE